MKLLLALTTASAVALSAGSAWSKDLIRVAGNFATEHSSSVAMELFKESLEKASGGEIEVTFFLPANSAVRPRTAGM